MCEVRPSTGAVPFPYQRVLPVSALYLPLTDHPEPTSLQHSPLYKKIGCLIPGPNRGCQMGKEYTVLKQRALEVLHWCLQGSLVVALLRAQAWT